MKAWYSLLVLIKSTCQDPTVLAAMQNGLGKLVGQVRTDQTDPSPFLSLAVEWICGFLARDGASPD